MWIMVQVFAKFDMDGDGYIDKKEFMALCHTRRLMSGNSIVSPKGSIITPSICCNKLFVAIA